MGWESGIINKPRVTIIDYGVGNILSVKRAFEHCGAEVKLTSSPSDVLLAERVVLPGVGSFSSAINSLNKLGLIGVIKGISKTDKPLLGICLGMQLLFDESEEFGLTNGLGLISGRVVSLPRRSILGKQLKIPHIGWSQLYHSNSLVNWNETLLKDNIYNDAVYFVHSFMAVPEDEQCRTADCIFGGHKITAMVVKGKITGCQFHPEKSGEAGLRILRRFISQ